MACTPTYRCQGTAMQAGESGASKTGTGGPDLQTSADAGITSSEMLGDGRCPSSPLAGEPGLKSPLA